MASLREEFDSLDASVMSRPSVQPFFGNEAVMLLVPEVGRRLNKALASLIEDTSVTMVDGSGLKPRLTTVLVL